MKILTAALIRSISKISEDFWPKAGNRQISGFLTVKLGSRLSETLSMHKIRNN